MAGTAPLEIEDGFDVFDAGMNAGIPPVLLQRNQLASAKNATLRDFLPSPRPPYLDVTLNFNGDTNLETAVKTGLFQGYCFYKPDVGAESLLASIGGRLFQFVIVASVATVFERTGSYSQSSTAQQCWLWQAEKWVVWNDGINLPVFFDGNTTRRSLGPATTLGTSTNAIALAAAGGVTTLTLVSAYTGSFNIPIRLTAGTQSALVQPLTSGTLADAYQITVKTLYISSGTTEALGATVTTKPGTIGFVTSSVPVFSLAQNQTADKTISVSDTTNAPVAGTTVRFGNNGGVLLSTTATTITARFTGQVFVGGGGVQTFNITSGSVVTTPSNTQPNVTVGTLSAAFTIPAVGASGTLKFNAAYAGASNAVLFIGNNQYVVQAVAGGTSSTTLNVQTISGSISTAAATTTTLTSVPELPAGRMGVYGLGRIWMALTDGRSYIAGDIVGGSAGTPAYNYLDSILRITENTFLAGGGVFVVPGAVGDIRAMRFVSELDKSLGQGPLQVLTPTVVFSCNAPIDRALWQSVTNPIQTQSLFSGGVGQNASVAHDNDLFFRSPDGIRSLILARRDFLTWGNVPISAEIQPFIEGDDQTLLPFSSMVVFDNRLLATIAPTLSASGVYFTQLAVINFDPLSSIRGKAPSIYDGIWDGLNCLGLVTGSFNQSSRAFAFVLNDNGEIALTELQSTGSQAHFDNGDTRIVQELEFPMFHFRARGKEDNALLRLTQGEIWVDKIDGATDFEIFFRPDYDTAYHPWYSWRSTPGPTWQPRMGFGSPPTDGDAQTERPFCEGHKFQLKLRMTGYARLVGGKCQAVVVPQSKYAPQGTPIPT